MRLRNRRLPTPALSVMFVVKELFTKNHLLLLHITLFLFILTALRLFALQVKRSKKVIKIIK